jgi:hypothetical protein
MEIQHSNTLKIHKLSKTQLTTAENAGTLDSTALYLTPAGTLTINVNNAKAGDFDGTEDKTINISCATTGHTHPISITNSSGTAVTSLAHGTTYTLTAGGSSTSFTLPSDNNTDTKVTQTQVSSSSYNYNYPLLMAANSTSTTSSQTTTTYKNYNKLYANPYSGQLTATTVSAGTFVATSDKRLKENIEPYTCEKSILELPVYTYNFIADDTKTKQIGCIAQELQEICPELVKEDEKGYLSINESKLVYLLLDEVKKLKREINDLRK